VKVVSSEDTKAALQVEIPEYESEMLEFSRKVVAASCRNAKMATVDGFVWPYLVRFMLRVINLFFGDKRS
jgi:hypothetical protein